jgi:DMSO reductase family type II enzyme heme b subunit
MNIGRIDASAATLLDPVAGVWSEVSTRKFAMVPTPLRGNPAIKEISPFIERSTDHGSIRELSVAGLHNGSEVALRLSWVCEKHSEIADLDQFVDGVAVMFPLGAGASAVTMGSKGDPVNAWYWKANSAEVGFNVVAEGYGTSERRPGADVQLICEAVHDGTRWHVVFRRTMDVGNQYTQFAPGTPHKVAFGVWDGGNRERAGRKSFSGEFVLAEIEA